jgi:uncharacterized membrane protein YfcA
MRSIIQCLMLVAPSESWKLVLAVVLGAAILVSAYAHAPRRVVPGSDLRRLVLAALLLYGVGALASLRHQAVIAAVVYAAGICACALAAWLSRGRDADDPPDGDEPADNSPPPTPDGAPEFDWASFERSFRAYSDRTPIGPRS